MSNQPLSERQQAIADELSKALRPRMEQLLHEVASLLASTAHTHPFGPTEFTLRDLIHDATADLMTTALRGKKNGYVGASVVCPECQQAAGFQGHRPRKAVSLFGEIQFCRAYYYCGRCGQGYFPFDEQAALSPRHLTPATEELVTLSGTLSDGFAEAATKVLPKMASLRVSTSTVERTTEDAGGCVGDSLERGETFGDKVAWDWRRDKHGHTVAYVSVDATSVPQQGSKGAKADGRMPYVAMVYNPPPEKANKPQTAATTATESEQLAVPAPATTAKAKAATQMQARYLAGLYTLPLLGLLLRRQAQQVGMEKAEQWIGLSDGGNGLEEFLRQNFNRESLVIILDFYHPASRLEELARLWHPGAEEQAKALAQQWCSRLKQQGGEALLAQLRALPPPKGKAVRAKYQEMLTYLDNQQHRMNYPSYVAQGWHIGSGPVESACKTVVNQRLKLAGMRWKEKGTDNVCHLRALLRSEKGQWDAFWSRRVNKGSIFYQPK
jgi:hypothetical protein